MAEVPQPQIKRGGTGPGTQQLPEGGAKEVNDAQKQVPKPGAASGGPEEQGGAPVSSHPLDQGGQMPPMDASGNEPDFSPNSEAEKFIFGPPDEGGSVGTNPPNTGVTAAVGGPGPVPADIHEWLPDLAQAARDPKAPPQVKSLFNLIMYHMENANQ